MRLVDADVENERLLDFIAQNDIGIQYAIEHKDMTILEDIFFDYFDGQAIAYDVDRVVGQLEEHTRGSSNIDYNRAIIEAIENVRSGGIRRSGGGSRRRLAEEADG